MIFTIGYGGHTKEELEALLREFGVEVLLDVRSRPFGKQESFNKGNLNFDGILYHWAGQRLGGFGKIKDDSLSWLADHASDKVVCLMCAERDYSSCHRHYEIARRLRERFGIEVHHIVGPGKTERGSFDS